ncbi:glycerol dehydrogenase [Pseudomonas moraviensis]|jgi:glycerol dehydrogenase|uniref:Glycerol dehydrogenase n=1 Tax=Pseudomonas moraviensis TaxID=321662 RepID=A0A7Y9W1C3_9PSED|nr:glycerol dehydrogenase [Pseudomonas moraviensis]NYH11863.1 glycerol dehydrogenase [Pseudomonas moraviensis]
MNLVFGSPGRYVQGTEVLAQAGAYLAHCGRSAVVVIDSYVLGLIRQRLDDSCAHAQVELHYITYDGEITADGIAGLRAAAANIEFEMILAVGGGKCIDAGKALAHSSGRALITMPTVASNDAPTSKNYVIYDDHHQLSEVGHLLVSPRYVLVDTSLIAQAPRPFLLAGIADALTKKFEAEQCYKAAGVNMFGARPALSGLVLARECYEVIRRYAEPALALAGTGEVTVAFDHLIEAVLLMSGLGFESGGLSIAHAMTRGLSKIPGAQQQVHGKQVAYGLLVQLVLEDRDAELMGDMLSFYQRIGLPRNLTELGVPEVDDALLRQVAEPTLKAPHAKNFVTDSGAALTCDELIAAMRALEGLTH